MPDQTAHPEEERFAARIAAALKKKEQGNPLNREDEDVIMAAAFRYLEEHGHELAPELLPELPETCKAALDAARPRALANALQALKEGEESKKSGERGGR